MSYIDNLYDNYFLEYASYSIRDRAIPHIDDGLKPVQRRILHALHKIDDGKFHKVANVVGQTMQYHPHGDQSIYGALIVLANKDLFIEKQGNFGNIFTGDEAAAARYIECRLTPLAKQVLFNKALTDYVDSYDGRNQEPVVFPAKIPVLLAQGAEGIAVGMATKILPHNLIELLEAQVAYLQDRSFQLRPDFPTGGLADFSAYNDGNGKVLVRARLDTADPKRIVIRDLPFGTTTEQLIASIEDAARKNKIKIGAISDYTAENVEIEIKLPRGTYTEEIVDALYAFTDCELSISANLMLINEHNRPQVMSATEVLQHNVDRLVDILKAELQLEAAQLNDRLHAKTLEQIFIENRIYQAIEEQTTTDEVDLAVRTGLWPFAPQIKRDITDDDIETLLKIPIRRISRYDINRAEKEMKEIRGPTAPDQEAFWTTLSPILSPFSKTSSTNTAANSRAAPKSWRSKEWMRARLPTATSNSATTKRPAISAIKSAAPPSATYRSTTLCSPSARTAPTRSSTRQTSYSSARACSTAA